MADNLPAPQEPVPGLVLYQSPDGTTRFQVRLDQETLWLTQRQLADLFQKDVRTINDHVANVFAEGELPPEATIRKYRIVQNEGGREVEWLVDHYSLDVVIAVGYRVRSTRGTQFRQWATATLREYLVKGFALDDQRLKEGKHFGTDYFDELLERIRAIRASERRFYQKITDIYATSVDYDANAALTQEFYATVQNKLHWAITGKTAAEIVAERADATKPNMGLTTWKNAPEGRITRADVSVAKNYLAEDEIKSLERIVSMYLDYAENQATRRIAMRMQDWVGKLDAFLQFNEYEILRDAGRVTHEVAKKLAESEYEKFRRAEDQAYVSDFEKAVKQLAAPAPKKKRKASE